MTIRVRCGQCAFGFQAPERYAGKRVKCPKCGSPIRMPHLPSQTHLVDNGFTAASMTDDSLFSESAMPVSHRRPSQLQFGRRRKEADRTLLYVVASLSGCVILVLSVALILVVSGGREVASDVEKTPDAAVAPAAESAPDVPAAMSDSFTWGEAPAAESYSESPSPDAESHAAESGATQTSVASYDAAPPVPTATAVPNPAVEDVAQSSDPPRQSSQPSEDDESWSSRRSRLDPAISPEELSAAVATSKESVCIIEHPLGSGTGFVVADDLVATNSHVVEGAYVEELEFHFSSAGLKKCRASRVLFDDPVRDLCLLKVDTDQASISIKEDYVFERGDQVVIVGNPALGETNIILRDAVNAGKINSMVHTGSCDYYQIDASVNCGSSGGPVMNLNGEVVGVVAMKATDQGEYEIRSAMRRLDDGFSKRFNTFSTKGIAFGIPGAHLVAAIRKTEEQSEAAAALVDNRHMARVLLGRMSTVGGLHLIQLHVNVPPGIRDQASRINLGHLPPSARNKIKLVPLLPAYTATQIARELQSEEVRKIYRVCSTGLEQKVNHLRDSDSFDQSTASSFENLYRAIMETKTSLQRPSSTYQAFSKTVSKHTDRLTTSIQRLRAQLDVAKAAYDD